jgi:hypothetical protein
MVAVVTTGAEDVVVNERSAPYTVWYEFVE